MGSRDNPVLEAGELSQLLQRFSRPGVPKYTALRDAVLHAVASGIVPPGARMPNEQELAKALPVSLGTIQRALRQLVEERVIHRQPGLGSFIAKPGGRNEMEHPFHCRFVDDSGKDYLPVFPEIVSRERVAGPGPWSGHLRCQEALRIVRRVRVGNEFNVHTSFWVDPKRLPVFETAAVRELTSENFKHVIFRSLGQAIHRVELFTRQEVPPRDVAALIGLKSRQMCTSMRVHAFLGNSDPIYYQHIFSPPTQRELHIVTDSRVAGFAP